MSHALKEFIGAAAERPLSREEAARAFDVLFQGNATEAQIGGFLMALRARGETIDEYTAAAEAMRARAIKVNAPQGAIDIVGTGGDGKGTLNISTAAAFVVAGAGVPVAKHGNRNLSSKSGTADVLGAIGVDVMVKPETVERAIHEAGIGFMMAPMHHPAMKHVMKPRQELGTRTLFNILGPLTNPAAVHYQLTGAFSAELLRPMAEVLDAVGVKQAWLVHGGDGTDELSISASSKVVMLNFGAFETFEIHPEEAGLPSHPFEDILGGNPDQNAEALRALLAGQKNAYRDAVLLNAAAALKIAGKAHDLKEGAEIAAASIDRGDAARAAAKLAEITQAGSRK